MKRSAFCALVAGLMLAGTAVAKFGTREPNAPIDRLIANTTAYIKENPKDALGPYALARIHYLALATRSKLLLDLGVNGRAAVNDTRGHIAEPPRPGGPNDWTEAQLLDHLKAAVENYRKALQMEPDNGLFHLGLASVSEAALTAGIKLGPIPGTAAPAPTMTDFAPLWREQAIAEYLRAHELSFKADTAIGFQPIEGIGSLVSYEAGQRYTAMVNARGIRSSEQQNLDKIKSAMQAIAKMPRGGVTPIVFRLDEGAPLEHLLDPGRTVTFDLDGTGRPQRYSWVRPDTGILVWDPTNEGRLTSGHQLFGSVSFNMFWSDGYRALDALDDNRDGVLRGNELDGLAVWFDRNQNGVSEPGEVQPISQTGIAAISARATSAVGPSLANEAGIEMQDGRSLPSYDWTTKALNHS